LADGINSVSDVAYYVVVSVFMRLASKPADEEHPYGHTQLETIAALVVGSFVITTAIAIFWESVNHVFDLWTGTGTYSGASALALWVALLTVVTKMILTVVTQRIGKSTKNPVVLALAYDHRNDIFTASAATIGIFLGRAGYVWVDPFAGALVALVILRTGIKIMRDSAADLMDTVPGTPLEKQISDLICPIPGVVEVEEIKVHRFGPYLVANITIGIDGDLSVAEGDRISTQVGRTMMSSIEEMRRIHVHYHPARVLEFAGVSR
jgi:cation diffusion facilitator family transporter